MFFSETFLSLELTDYCNCACIMCSQGVRHVIHGETKGFMDVSLLEKLLADLEKEEVKIYKLLPFGLGESLLHPQFKDIFLLFDRYRKKGLISLIDLHTNAQILFPELSEFIIKKQCLDTISFSLDAVFPDTYRRIRRFGGFEETVNNVKEFIKLRKKYQTIYPKVILQLIVMKANRDEVDAFIKYWSDFFSEEGLEYQLNFFWYPPMEKDTIFIKELNPFTSEEVEEAKKLHRFFAQKYGKLEIIKDEEKEKEVKENIIIEGSGICSGPFKYISVAWDGTVTVCCIDTERELAVGNLRQNSIKEIWCGEKINEIRKSLILKDYTACPRCRTCQGLDSPLLYKEELEKVKEVLKI